MASSAFTPVNKRGASFVSVKHSITPPLFAKALCREIIYTESFRSQPVRHKVMSNRNGPAVALYTNQQEHSSSITNLCGSNMGLINPAYYSGTLMQLFLTMPVDREIKRSLINFFFLQTLDTFYSVNCF